MKNINNIEVLTKDDLEYIFTSIKDDELIEFVDNLIEYRLIKMGH